MSEFPAASSISRADRMPTFLIIGAMRSGTTTLANFLRRHYDVFMAAPKELHFFDFEFRKGIPWYLSHFELAGSRRAIGEATPNYLYFSEALFRIARTLPWIKVVAILRNPVERAYSHYWHNRSTGDETLDFSESIRLEAKRLRTSDPRSRAMWSYIDRGFYLRQLKIAEQNFGRPQMLVLLFDDLKDDPSEVFLRLCEFLAIRQLDTSRGASLVMNRFVGTRSRTLRRVASHMPKRAGSVLRKVNTRLDESYPPMKKADLRHLIDLYSDANQSLGAWLGRDLLRWSLES